jgi:hypothetical protein
LIRGAGSTVKDSVIDTDTTGIHNKLLVDSILTSQIGFCRKGFIFITRFTEKYFGEKIIYVVGYEGSEEVMRTYRKYMPPIMTTQFVVKGTQAVPAIGEGSVLIQPFNFFLDSATSIIDNGFARITRVSLIMAKKPDDLIWTNPLSAVKQLTPNKLIYEYRATVFDYPLDHLSSSLQEIRWLNIDPRQWSSGNYLMGVAVRDEFGYWRFANTDYERFKTTNPWMVTIKTAQ